MTDKPHNNGLSDVMKSEGWRINTDGNKCEKVYDIDGRWYLCRATLSRDGDLWTVELFWPDEDGLYPSIPGSTLEEAARCVEDQIEVLRMCDHGHVDGGRDHG